MSANADYEYEPSHLSVA